MNYLNGYLSELLKKPLMFLNIKLIPSDLTLTLTWEELPCGEPLNWLKFLPINKMEVK